MKRPSREISKRQGRRLISRRPKPSRGMRSTQLLLETLEPRIVLTGTPQSIDLNPTAASNAADFDQAGDLTTVSDDGQLVEVSNLESHGRVSGVKFFDVNTNGTFDDSDIPLADLTVYVDANENGQFDVGEISTTTDDEGQYFLELEPGTYTIVAEVTDSHFPTAPVDSPGLEVTVEIGREVEDVNFGEVTEEAPADINLLADSDTGDLDDDDLTLRNNASANSTLTFVVSGLFEGSIVRLFRDGVLIGTADSELGLATVTTDGTTKFEDGTHSITATQVVASHESPLSNPLIITIDTVAPTVTADSASELAKIDELYTFEPESPDKGQATFALKDAPDGMTINPQSGLINWTPTANQTGPQQLDVLAVDSTGNVGSQTISLTVLGEVPAIPDEYLLSEDGSLLIGSSTGPLANDGDAESGTLTARLISNPSNGTVSLLANGSFLYTPDADFFGTDSFTYQAADGDKLSNVAQVTFDIQSLNDAPQATEDAYITPEDTPLVVLVTNGVLANDDDIDGDPLVVELANQPSNGVLTLNSDGSFAYTPDANFFGVDSFAYRVNDGTVVSDPVSAVIVVTTVDDPPQAVADDYRVNEDDVLDVNASDGVLDNDSDPDGDAAVAVRQEPSNGTVTLNTDGSFTYTPNADFAGTDSFTYSISDGVNESIAAATIVVVGQPDAPTANNDNSDVTNDAADHTLNVLANDTFAPDTEDSLTVVSVTQGDQGGAVTLTDGQVIYRPASGFAGDESFDYTIEDSDGLRSTATVTVTVTADETRGNSVSGFVYVDRDANGQRSADESGVPGVLITLSGTASSGESIDRSMFTTDDGSYLFQELPTGTYQVIQRQPTSLVDGQESSRVSGVDLSTNDQIIDLAINGRQAFTDNNFGETRFRASHISIVWFFASATPTSRVFREAIATGEESIGEFELATAIREDSVVPPDVVNRAPIAVADRYTVGQGSSLITTRADGLLVNDADPDGDSLNALLVSDVSNGSLDLNSDGSFSYSPDNGFAGTDTFSYQVSDGFLTSNDVAVTITVEEIDNTFSLDENSATGTTVGRVELGNVDTLSYSIKDATTPDDLLLRPDDHLSGDLEARLVLVEYLDFQCSTCRDLHSVVETLVDELEGDLLVVRRHLPSTTPDSNAFAAAVAAEAAGRQDNFDAMANLLFENQDAWTGETDPESLFEDYADQLDLNLTTFRSDLDDPALADRVRRDMDTADRLGVSEAPTFYLNGDLVDIDDATDDFEDVVENVLRDFDQPFVINRETGDILVADGNVLNFESTPSFALTVAGTDVEGNSTTTIVTINLVDINEASPVAFADTYDTTQDVTLTIDASFGLLDNDSDADGDPLTAIAVTSPTNGILTTGDDGSFVYVPNVDFVGTDSFTYQASDGDRTSNIATVTLNVAPVDSPPVAVDDAYSVDEDMSLSVSAAMGLLANDQDDDGEILFPRIEVSPSNGALQLSLDGSFTYTPNDDFNGADSFIYQVSDGRFFSNMATVTINVNAVNDPPQGTDDAYTTNENVALNVIAELGVLNNDSDPENDSIIAKVASQPSNGTLLLAANGAFQYTPDDGFNGTDSFTYRVDDGLLESEPAAVAITVNPLGPFAVPTASAAAELTASLIDGAMADEESWLLPS